MFRSRRRFDCKPSPAALLKADLPMNSLLSDGGWAVDLIAPQDAEVWWRTACWSFETWSAHPEATIGQKEKREQNERPPARANIAQYGREAFIRRAWNIVQLLSAG